MGKKKSKGFIFKLLLIIALCLSIGGYLAYRNIYQPNVNLSGGNSQTVFIPKNTNYTELLQILYNDNLIVNKSSFEWMAKQMHLDKNFTCGKYRIQRGMSNRQIINLLKYGKTEKVKLKFNYLDRTNSEIAKKISERLNISEETILEYFNNEELLKNKYGMNKENIRCLFVPGTFEFEWCISMEELMDFFHEKHLAIWTKERLEKVKKTGLEKSEIIVLASIVQRESHIYSEQRKIAGVYLNRLQKSIKLQADPTVIFAKEDFSIKRVKKSDLAFDSPYNTYLYSGLPPGPICIPYAETLDAVLDFEKHDYIYFCAKPELSGYSNYAITYQDHLKNARAYQEEMNKKKIFR